jgi:hypothetical protein
MSAQRMLSDGKVGTAGVVLFDGVVSRAAGPGAASVHRLLSVLNDAGFVVPRPIELIDDARFERLTFVDGTTPTLPWPGWMADEALLTSAVQMLRRLHDQTAHLMSNEPGWIGLPWWRWVASDGSERPVEVIRHGDPWPPNLVVDGGQAVAWIDWDFAQPGSRLDDLGAFAKHWAPLMSDERAEAHGWQPVPDRQRRLRLIADAYDHPSVSPTSLVRAAIDFARSTAISHRRWASEGQRPFAVMAARGITAAIEADGTWLAANSATLVAPSSRPHRALIRPLTRGDAQPKLPSKVVDPTT